jgi:hypothetical protein
MKKNYPAFENLKKANEKWMQSSQQEDSPTLLAQRREADRAARDEVAKATRRSFWISFILCCLLFVVVGLLGAIFARETVGSRWPTNVQKMVGSHLPPLDDYPPEARLQIEKAREVQPTERKSADGNSTP